MSRMDLILITLLNLGAFKKSVDTEDIAIKAHELVPDAFSWKKYPNQVNLELVRVTLSDLKKPQNGTLVAGSGREGWRFTDSGFSQARKISRVMPKENLQVAAGSAGSIDTVRQSKDIKRIINSDAYLNWIAGNYISDESICNLLKMNQYTGSKIVQIKLVRLRSLIDSSPDLEPFVDLLQKRVEKILDEQ